MTDFPSDLIFPFTSPSATVGASFEETQVKLLTSIDSFQQRLVDTQALNTNTEKLAHLEVKIKKKAAQLSPIQMDMLVITQSLQ